MHPLHFRSAGANRTALSMSRVPMERNPPVLHASDLHGLSLLAVDGVGGVTDIVEHLHAAILRPPGLRSISFDARTGGIPGIVYRSIHGVTSLVGMGLRGIGSLAIPSRQGSESSEARERFLAVVNGILGDHLARTDNPLAIPATLRQRGRPVRLDAESIAAAWPGTSKRLLLRAHGLCLHDGHWGTKNLDERGRGRPEATGEYHGSCDPLALLPGIATVDFHYNTGRRIEENGRDLSELLERLVSLWPVKIEELTMLGFSMGGLVARSALHHATEIGYAWPNDLKKIVFLGTPHHGSPLERAGHVVDRALGISRYSAPFARLGRIRSSGITDLRYGNITTPNRDGSDNSEPAQAACPFPSLPPHVECFAIAATLDDDADSLKSRTIGDGLVPVPSALGQHSSRARRLDIPSRNQRVMTGTRHLDLLRCQKIRQLLVDWLR